MDIQRKIHNIVASIVLAEPMRQLRNEFMMGIRGYLCPNDHDRELLIRAEHAAREAMERTLLEGVQS